MCVFGTPTLWWHREKNMGIHAKLPTMTKFILECRMWCNLTSTLSNGSAQYTQKGRWMDITNWKRKTPWENHWNVSFCLSFIFAPQTHSYTTIYIIPCEKQPETKRLMSFSPLKTFLAPRQHAHFWGCSRQDVKNRNILLLFVERCRHCYGACWWNFYEFTRECALRMICYISRCLFFRTLYCFSS